MFLQGVWKGLGETDQKTQYNEQTTITHIKGPIYMYTQITQRLPQNTHLHTESGYFRIFPNDEEQKETGKIELLLSQQQGRCIIEEGIYNKNNVELKSCSITQTISSDKPYVTETKRKYWLDEQNNLNYVVDVGSVDFPIKNHVKAKLIKQD